MHIKIKQVRFILESIMAGEVSLRAFFFGLRRV
jgi:hypothetical protein